MKRSRQHDHTGPPRLIPAGSVDRVLLVGGKNLTTFQSIGAFVMGMCIAGAGIGTVVAFGGLGVGAIFLTLLGCALILMGCAAAVNGILGFARSMRKVSQ